MNATLRRAAITAIAGFSLALTALSVQAQNAAIVNGKAIPSVRVDEFVASLTQQGRPDTPDLRNAVRDELIAREIEPHVIEVHGPGREQWAAQAPSLGCDRVETVGETTFAY